MKKPKNLSTYTTYPIAAHDTYEDFFLSICRGSSIGSGGGFLNQLKTCYQGRAGRCQKFAFPMAVMMTFIHLQLDHNVFKLHGLWLSVV